MSYLPPSNLLAKKNERENYWIYQHNQEAIKDFLDRHHIAYEITHHPRVLPVTIQKVLEKQAVLKDNGQSTIYYAVKERITSYRTQKGDLLVTLHQLKQRLIPLLFEPASLGSIFAFPEYSNLVHENDDFFIYRVNKEGM